MGGTKSCRLNFWKMRFKKFFWQPKYTAIFFEIFSTEFSQIFLKNLEFTFFHLSKFYKGVDLFDKIRNELC